MRAMTRGLVGVTLLSVGVVGCVDDEAARIESLEEELATVAAERDELAAQVSDREARHAASLATIEGVEAILADPDSFGTEDEVVDALAAFAADGTVMDDAVFGAADYRTAWRNTLFGGAIDADIDVYHHWLSEDGSQGGSLWVWHGTNAAGNPFELAGISLNEYDEDGQLTYELVTYPYPDEYVEAAVVGKGTVSVTSAAMATTPERPFSFADDDLCEWITEVEIAAMVAAVYDWSGEATLVPPLDMACRWELTGDDELPPFVGITEVDHGEDRTRPWAEDETFSIDDVVVVGHPELSEGAGYYIGLFGYFAVGVPEDGRYVGLSVMMPADTVLLEDWATGMIRIGDLVLRELGWVG